LLINSRFDISMFSADAFRFIFDAEMMPLLILLRQRAIAEPAPRFILSFSRWPDFARAELASSDDTIFSRCDRTDISRHIFADRCRHIYCYAE
jgi:hypothetical protein